MKKDLRRADFLDVIKGFAVILMIIGHCIQYGSGYSNLINGAHFSNVLFKFIYSFHMPLFMLVSGYLFFYYVNKYSFVEIIIKKLKQLLIPILSYTVIDSVIYSAMNGH